MKMNKYFKTDSENYSKIRTLIYNFEVFNKFL